MLTRKALITETRLKGCTFSKASIEELERYTRSNHLDDQYKDVVRQICDKIKEVGVTGSVTPEILQNAIESIHTNDQEKERFFVISAYDTPKYTYDATRNVFHKFPKNNTITGGARDKADVYRDRYELLYQRISRYDLFVKPAFDMKQSKSKLEISTISSLEGTESGQTVTVMGMLYRKDDGTYMMEDLHKTIPVSLDQVKYTPGLFVDGAFVVTQGQFSDGVYHLSGIGFPPAETRQKSLAAISGNLDFFGLAQRRGVLEDEQSCPALFIVLADVFLNDLKVIQRLRSLFSALAASEDPATLHFFLVGNFMEVPFNYGDCGSFTQFSQSERAKYTQGFDKLGDVIAEFPTIATKSSFTVMPGPHDPTPGGFILPQAPIPQTFTAGFRKRVSNVTMTTNPCRIRFFTQEIVMFRDESYRKMRRHCLEALPPLSSEEAYNHLVKTMVDQAHLSPVPVTVTPIYWMHDHALRLFPLPDVVVACDSSESWETEYLQAAFLNSGSFSKNQTFLMYRPNSRQHQFQQMR
jgi:DNA polymerase epsilon subunit 2